MITLAIYLRLIMYPLLSLGLFMLATCCLRRRIDALVYGLLSLMPLFQLAKAFQQLNNPIVHQVWAEWGLAIVLVLCVIAVWLDFYQIQRKH